MGIVMSTDMTCSSFPWTQYESLETVPSLDVIVMVVPDVVYVPVSDVVCAGTVNVQVHVLVPEQ